MNRTSIRLLPQCGLPSSPSVTRRGLGMSQSHRLALSLVSSLLAGPAFAAEVSVSGFGTAGYTQSDQSFGYQRFIDDSGTFTRDSLFGVQADAKLFHKFGATLQLKAAASNSSDHELGVTVEWAFVSYRPTNSWLLRAGKLRVPIYMNSENLDVGVTFDFARLPPEVYSLSTNLNFTGLSFAKNWSVRTSELTLDGYWGRAKVDFRFWLRDDIPPVQGAGARFERFDVEALGLGLTLRPGESTYRAHVSRATAKLPSGTFPSTFPFVTLFPGVGYYQTSPQLPGPGIPQTDRVRNTIVILGADVSLPAGIHVVGEYVRRIVQKSEIGPDSSGGYLSLFKRFGRFRPYVTYALLRSQPEERQLYRAVNDNTVPSFVPGAAQINLAQRAGADGIVAYDQSSWALGTSYSPSPRSKIKSKIKAEFQRVHIGEASSFVDGPPGGNVRDRNINIFSLSYNFVF